MRAILKEDFIIKISEKHGEKIGKLPKGVGLERLRFDGEKVVDLSEAKEIWVRPKGGTFFELHAVEVSGSQKINMSYRDRRKLILDKGQVKLLTEEEHKAKQILENDDIEDNRKLRKDMDNFIENLTFSKIDKHIEVVFGRLNIRQKKSLKLLYKTVLWLAKTRR